MKNLADLSSLKPYKFNKQFANSLFKIQFNPRKVQFNPNYKPMLQKRELFQKQIRREAIQKIFKNKRLKHFKYIFKPVQTLQNTNEINDQCLSQFSRFSEELTIALKQQNFQNIYIAVKDSYYSLERLMAKAEQISECLMFIVQNWFTFGFDKMLIECTKLYEQINKVSFSSIRKQTHKYAVSQFNLIFQYESVIQKENEKIDGIFNFLFLALIELQNELQSIEQILLLVNQIIHFDTQMRHKFFFYNQRHNEFQSNKLISFNKICPVIFNNAQRLKHYSTEQQKSKFNKVKVCFIQLFKLYCDEITYMENFIKNYKNKNNYNTDLKSKQHQIYEKTLSLVNFPEKIKLKCFLDKQIISIVLQITQQMRTYYVQHWTQCPIYQQNLANCLYVFGRIIEFQPKFKIIEQFEYELKQLLNLLISRELSIIVKNQIIALIDTIIFIDDNNIITNYLVENQNMFQKVWSYQQPSILNVKLNIVNNLLLFNSGFKVVVRYLSQIFIVLNQTKLVSLALTFCWNYFVYTNFDLDPACRFDLIIKILYNLPSDSFTLEDIEMERMIFTYLYQDGFSIELPQRYKIWSQENNVWTQNRDYVQITKSSQNEKRIKLIDDIIEISTKYRKDAQQFCDMQQ